MARGVGDDAVSKWTNAWNEHRLLAKRMVDSSSILDKGCRRIGGGLPKNSRAEVAILKNVCMAYSFVSYFRSRLAFNSLHEVSTT